jgi:UDP-glucose 4-epimerase
MSILVTGAAGYIGRHVLRALGGDVVALDLVEPAYRAIPPGVEFVRGDVRNRVQLDRLFETNRIDGVIHLAARKSVAESIHDPGGYFDHNVSGSFTLLSAMAAAGARRFVFSSSAAVYGVPSTVPVDESAPLRPTNPYGETKVLVERALPWFEHAHGLRYASLRYFNAAGADPSGDIGEDLTGSANLIPVVMRATLRTGPAVPIFGRDHPTPDGTPIRDYVHVVDLAKAHIRALEALEGARPSLTVNLGTGVGSSVLEIIRAVEDVSGEVVPRQDTARRPGDPPAIWADVDRARRELGWEASYGMRDIIETSWRWHSRGKRPRLVTGEGA